MGACDTPLKPAMERLMQYVWQHRLFPPRGLTTVDGIRVSVIDQGRINTGPGPDFFNAKVMIGGRLWAGDVEIHVRASDWHRHGHDSDPAYDSVILHVVDRDDTMIRRRNGETIPQLALPCSPEFGDRYRLLTDRAPGPVLACRHVIGTMAPVHILDWISALALERLHSKADRITQMLGQYAGDWDQAAFVTLARALGFGQLSNYGGGYCQGKSKGGGKDLSRWQTGYIGGGGSDTDGERHIDSAGIWRGL